MLRSLVGSEMCIRDRFEGDPTCSICLCEYEEEEELRAMPSCTHVFHVTCIDEWLVLNQSCPVCRQPLNKDGTAAAPQSLESHDGTWVEMQEVDPPSPTSEHSELL
eukprot:TRINITY_DN19978_c0_g1_i5.p1 TRINITY_DN19978_c0_g1~~TRINITY_DN19978_c0_g1_i5.p1  ORF type:complete len:106 (+),score=27.29 TRINITY_DN19978_c0_g1_i5:128-445(+)